MLLKDNNDLTVNKDILKEKKYCVYMHISPNNKKYIGLTGRKPERRWRNGEGYKKHPYFYSAIKLYGWENFEHRILFDNLTKEDAERIEHLCIALFKTYIKDFGYNLSKGGESGSYGCKKSEEQKEHLRQINLGKKLSEETKDKLSKAHTGLKMNLSDEQRAKKSQEFMKNNPNSRRVYCLETDKEYYSGAEAARELNLIGSAGNVARCCRKEIKSFKGYHFCFAEEKENFDWNEVKTNRKRKKIYCLETGITYESAAEAARKIFGNNQNGGIIRNCQGKQKTCKGYHFSYADEGGGENDFNTR